MNSQLLLNSIKLHEGLVLTPYLDTEGNITIGYGTNLKAGIYLDEAEYLLSNRIQIAISETVTQPWWPNVSGNDPRSRALVEMVYNLGPNGIREFVTATGLLCKNDFINAAEAFMDSLWSKQVGKRATILTQMIATGQDPTPPA